MGRSLTSGHLCGRLRTPFSSPWILGLHTNETGLRHSAVKAEAGGHAGGRRRRGGAHVSTLPRVKAARSGCAAAGARLAAA